MLARFMSAAAIAALLAGAGPADAEISVTVAPNGLGSGPIMVKSDNGTQWTRIVSAPLILPVKARAGMTNHTFAEYGGAQYKLFLGEKPLTIKNDRNPATGTHTLAANSEDLSGIDRTRILALCNARLKVGGGINQDHKILGEVTVRIDGHFRRHVYDNSSDSATSELGPYQNTATVSVPVHCIGAPRPAGPTTVLKGSAPPRRFCAGGRVYSTRSMPPTYFCKCNATGWTAVSTGSQTWKCVNKRNGGGVNATQKSTIDTQKARQRRTGSKAAHQAANRHKGLQDTVNRRATMMVAPNGKRHPGGLQDTLNRRATLKVAPNGKNRPNELQDTLNKRATMKVAPNNSQRPKGPQTLQNATTGRTPPKRRIAPKRRTPEGSTQLMLQRRR